MEIHETSLIDKDAVIGSNVKIGAFSIIGPDVVIEDNCIIENNVTIKGNTKISENVFIGSYCNIGCDGYFMSNDKKITKLASNVTIHPNNHFGNNVSVKGNTEIKSNNFIGAYTTLGFPAQDRGNSEKPVFLKIGENNDFREYVSINCGSHGGSGTTVIGDNNMLMCYAHVGHDCSIANNCTIANSTTLAGHVEIGSYVVTGGFAGIHQFCKVGDFSMIGGMSGVVQDVPPYLLVTGARAKVYGINTIGLTRNGFTQDDMKIVNKIFQIFFKDMIPTKKAIEKMKLEIEAGPVLDRFVKFIGRSNRGILKMI